MHWMKVVPWNKLYLSEADLSRLRGKATLPGIGRDSDTMSSLPMTTSYSPPFQPEFPSYREESSQDSSRDEGFQSSLKLTSSVAYISEFAFVEGVGHCEVLCLAPPHVKHLPFTSCFSLSLRKLFLSFLFVCCFCLRSP